MHNQPYLPNAAIMRCLPHSSESTAYTKQFDEHSYPPLNPWNKTKKSMCTGSWPYLPSRSGPLTTQQLHQMSASRNQYRYNINRMQADAQHGCNFTLSSSLCPADICMKRFPTPSYSSIAQFVRKTKNAS